MKIRLGNRMQFPDELLEEALRAVQLQPGDQRQGRLRRAISTAYYALFHLLIEEAVANWSRSEQRERLARSFQHKQMKKASGQVGGRPYDGESPDIVNKLRHIASCFVELQENRHDADYNKAKRWNQQDALDKVERVQRAFANVTAIRSEQIFQDYLLSLFVQEYWEEER